MDGRKEVSRVRRYGHRMTALLLVCAVPGATQWAYELFGSSLFAVFSVVATGTTDGTTGQVVVQSAGLVGTVVAACLTAVLWRRKPPAAVMIAAAFTTVISLLAFTPLNTW